MRFKIRNLQGQNKHEDMCTSVSWCSFNELTRYFQPHPASATITSSTSGMPTPVSPPSGWNLTPTLLTMIGCHSAGAPVTLWLWVLAMAPSNLSIKTAKSRRTSPTKHIRNQLFPSSGVTMGVPWLPPVKTASLKSGPKMAISGPIWSPQTDPYTQSHGVLRVMQFCTVSTSLYLSNP